MMGAQGGVPRPGSRQENSDSNRKSSGALTLRKSQKNNGSRINVEVLAPERNEYADSAHDKSPGQQIDLTTQTQASGLKVSAATLKRRAKELDKVKKDAIELSASRAKNQDKSKERKSLFQRLGNSTFFKQENAADEI